MNTLIDEMVAQNAARHPWRPAEFVREMASHFTEQGVPWCPECADWHHADEEHSMVEA